MRDKIPARTLPPLTRNYCVLNRVDFINLLNHIKDVLQEEYKKSFKFEIEIEGFDHPFSSPEDVTKSLTKHEWKKLGLIEIKLYSASDDIYEVLVIQLGGMAPPRSNSSSNSTQPIGFQCVIKSGTTSQKVATKERIRLLVEDYGRKPLNVFISGLIVSGACYALALILIAIIRYRLEYTELADSIQKSILVVPIAGFLIGALTYGYLFPVVEYIEEGEKTKWQKANKHFYSLLAIIGVVLAIVAFLPAKK